MILFFNVCDLESIFPLSKASLLLLSYYTLLTSYMIYMRWNLAEVLTSLCRFCIGIRSSILKMSLKLFFPLFPYVKNGTNIPKSY